MTYRYWYTREDQRWVIFCDTQTDLIELGPLPFTTKQAFARIQHEASKLGRKVLSIERIVHRRKK